MYRKTLFHFIILSALIFGIMSTACKKEPKAPAVASAADLSKDTLYYLFKDEYLFTDNIPAYDVVNPHSFANNDSLFNKLIRYQTAPLDHYSFMDKSGAVSSSIGQGIAQGDFGFEIFYPDYLNNPGDLRVKYVTKGSPASLKGIHKGWQITSINSNPNIAYDGNGSSVNVNRVLTAVFDSPSTNFDFKKPDGTSVNMTVAAASYTINPVLLDTVYAMGGKKIGYLVFNSFIEITKIQAQMDAVFAKFVSQGVTNLVVDLRYNGGGAVDASEYLANLIAPKSVGSNNTSLMYTYDFNSRIKQNTFSEITKGYKLPPPDQQFNYGDLFYSFAQNNATYFSKKGDLDIKNVIFIVSKSTASASELLINNLLPYMDVTLIGRQTYGKPVGFIGIPVGGYDMYAISFRTLNSKGQGDYYNGMTVAVNMSEDYSKDFGQLDEVYLNQALIKLGVKSLPALKAQKASVGTLTDKKFDRNFKGMIKTNTLK